MSRVNITPPIGCLMAGYGGRTHGAEGIRDELWSRALYLHDGETELVLLGADILGLRRESVERIQSRVHEETGIPRSHIIFSATHTHSGPNCISPAADDGLTARNLAATEDKLAGAAIWAKAQASPGRLYRHYATVRCGVNRREWRDGKIVLGINPAGPIDPSVDILHVTDEAGKTRGVWFAHACHPVVMGSSNYLISGDFAGAASRFVEEVTGGVAIFANGATGNINSLPHNATFDDVDRLGRRLGAAVVQSLTQVPDAAEVSPRLGVREVPVSLPIDPVPAAQEAHKQVEAAEADVRQAEANENANRIFWAKRALRSAKELYELAKSGTQVEGAPSVLSLASIGEFALVGVPAEVFVELGLRTRERSPFARTTVLSYTGGYQGYLPTKEAFAEGGYEVNTRIRHRGLAITPHAGQTVVDEGVRALQELQAQQGS